LIHFYKINARAKSFSCIQGFDLTKRLTQANLPPDDSNEKGSLCLYGQYLPQPDG